ncbi:hypothetical protein DIS09_20550 [Burkholderia pseudomallei]|nr:hypothetical protein EGY14_29235 [Burkholderia pseudomallei]PPF04992.1 hypothetical protein B9D88_023580 [Burkholderia pseudomallei]TOZ54767.1 hypothetical protein DIJ60_17295 [Burkholderia pseudomallei]TPA12814.1 hypothetical protein DIJ61_22625 [Burkholderia pseudomallei]TPE96810.1 hypothetical protein DIS09_20550 [Burkholderia pseudomallei]
MSAFEPRRSNFDTRTSAIELRHSIAGARRTACDARLPASIDAGVAGDAIGTFAARAAFAAFAVHG